MGPSLAHSSAPFIMLLLLCLRWPAGFKNVQHVGPLLPVKHGRTKCMCHPKGQDIMELKPSLIGPEKPFLPRTKHGEYIKRIGALVSQRGVRTERQAKLLS